MADDSFFDEKSLASGVKARIVSKYFDTWSNIVLPSAIRAGTNIAYQDLYCGPGVYRNNEKSTPILVLERAIAKPDLCKRLITIFNDENEEYVESLRKEIEELPGIEKLEHKPVVMCTSIGADVEDHFRKTRTIPAFTFLDPFGYVGLTLGLIQGVIKDWGCDCIFFFNYKRINRALSAGVFRERMEALFGPERARALEQELAQVKGRSSRQQAIKREDAIVEALTAAMKDIDGSYVRPFRFVQGVRTSHMLVGVTKHPKGHRQMKEIMAKENNDPESDVPSYTFFQPAPPSGRLFDYSMDKLKEDLCATYAGRTTTMGVIFAQHSDRKDYLERNYKEALNQLEEEKRITAEPPAHARPKRNNRPTFADGVIVRFPGRKK